MLPKRWGTASRLAQVTPQLSSPLKLPARRPKVCLAGGNSRDAELFREQSGLQPVLEIVDGRDRELPHWPPTGSGVLPE
jgi:hypothetical protein